MLASFYEPLFKAIGLLGETNTRILQANTEEKWIERIYEPFGNTWISAWIIHYSFSIFLLNTLSNYLQCMVEKN